MHPGSISDEGGSEGRAANAIRSRNRPPAGSLARPKPLDWRAPVTEVLTIGGSLNNTLIDKQMAVHKLLIIDELGFVPLSKTSAELLFELISQRYERGATLITSNLPFHDWTEAFGSERLTGALLDRLTPPRQHPRDERRQLPPRTEPRPPGRRDQLNASPGLALPDQRAPAAASHLGSAAAEPRNPFQPSAKGTLNW